MNDREQEELEQLKGKIDRLGRRLSREDWIEMCEELESYYRSFADAAREERG